MAEKKTSRFPFLYVVSCLMILIGTGGLVYTFLAAPPPDTFKGFLYIFAGFIAFGAGEMLNHPKAQMITAGEDTSPSFSNRFNRKRNPCSLGNLLDIGALLLFFVGLSNLLFRA